MKVGFKKIMVWKIEYVFSCLQTKFIRNSEGEMAKRKLKTVLNFFKCRWKHNKIHGKWKKEMQF